MHLTALRDYTALKSACKYMKAQDNFALCALSEYTDNVSIKQALGISELTRSPVKSAVVEFLLQRDRIAAGNLRSRQTCPKDPRGRDHSNR